MEKGRQLAIAAGVAVGAWQGHKPRGQLGWGSQSWLVAPGPGAALEDSLAEAWTEGQVQMALDLAKLCPGSPSYGHGLVFAADSGRLRYGIRMMCGGRVPEQSQYSQPTAAAFLPSCSWLL